MTADGPASVEIAIRALALKYANELKSKIDGRLIEMETDDTSHYLIYQVLGISDDLSKQRPVSLQVCRFVFRGGRQAVLP